MRKIIHADCDCFFAAVEMRDDPYLQGRPVAVGGDPGRRGVIATCNYEARQYGVRSAQASAYARKLCPGLIIIPPDFAKYKAASRQIRSIFFDFTELVEPLSLDEAYLDVSDSPHCQGSATLIAREIRARVKAEVGVTISCGVAPNKFLAKIASDWQKPDGLFVIKPDEALAFVEKLPVGKIHGVGPATRDHLNRLGLETCGDIRSKTVFELAAEFGSFGPRLHQLARGEDNRPVSPARQRKSLSVEETYAKDLPDVVACRNELPALLFQLVTRLKAIPDHYRITKIFVKLKFNDFTQTTHEQVAKELSLPVLQTLLAVAWERERLPVRLIGIGVGFIDLRDEIAETQLDLFDKELLPE